MDHQQKPEEHKDAAPPRDNGKEPSMSSRIAASASGLARNAFGSGSADEARSAFASGSGLSRKLQSGTEAAGPSTWAQTLPSRQNGSSSRAINGSGEQFRSQEGFRSTSTEFSLDDHFDMDSYRALDGLGEFAGYGSKSSHQSASNGHNGPDDGAEVRRLLSDPSFSTEEFVDMQMADPTPETVNDLFGQNFSPEEKEIADKMKSSLPPPPQHNGVSPQNPLNLRPEFANPQLEEEIRDLSRTLESGEEGVMAFSNAQRHHWLAEWDDVLNGYTDEVWGEMLPVVKAARSQLEEAKTGMDRLDSKAVARLRMILGHVVDASNTTSSAAQFNGQDYGQDHGQDYAVQEVQRKGEQQPAGGSEWAVPAFHCPYVSCHEQFGNESELRTHSQQHSGAACAHFDCGAWFEDSKEWADHVKRAHHGLLEARPGDEDLGV
ncbi:zinc finger c2h2-type protein [Diplodia corticola]|uniref:Zinc finger c2h2-type protein n=1 Tax=Diplodia corticola TaxID=236234 RepID=A0A1J9QR34_9PEZI|nr:zinc finger c2h2-type protein [Diplodia corticola]OJD30912.1 zinc finger c2h2-type protein [Diplodia corticola]